MAINDILEIKGVSQKGKNRIREHGKLWKVIQEADRCQCLDNKPGILLEANDGYWRWMALEDDKDFSFTRL